MGQKQTKIALDEYVLYISLDKHQTLDLYAQQINKHNRRKARAYQGNFDTTDLPLQIRRQFKNSKNIYDYMLKKTGHGCCANKCSSGSQRQFMSRMDFVDGRLMFKKDGIDKVFFLDLKQVQSSEIKRDSVQFVGGERDKVSLQDRLQQQQLRERQNKMPSVSSQQSPPRSYYPNIHQPQQKSPRHSQQSFIQQFNISQSTQSRQDSLYINNLRSQEAKSNRSPLPSSDRKSSNRSNTSIDIKFHVKETFVKQSTAISCEKVSSLKQNQSPSIAKVLSKSKIFSSNSKSQQKKQSASTVSSSKDNKKSSKKKIADYEKTSSNLPLDSNRHIFLGLNKSNNNVDENIQSTANALMTENQMDFQKNCKQYHILLNLYRKQFKQIDYQIDKILDSDKCKHNEIVAIDLGTALYATDYSFQFFD